MSKKKKKKRRLSKKAFTSFTAIGPAPKPVTVTTCKLIVRPAPVAGNPFPGLFTGDDADSLLFQAGPDTEDSFLSQLGTMVHLEPNDNGLWPTETVNSITMATAARWNAAESIESSNDPEQLLNEYDIEEGSDFGAAVDALLVSDSPYEVDHVANRATAASCGGCHRLSGAFDRRDLGNEVTWDSTIFFTHVDSSGGRSNIMNEDFLPHRKSVMGRYLAKTCEECLDKALLRDIDGEFLTTEDLDLTAPESSKGTAALPAPSPTLAKDVVELGGEATLSGSRTH